MQVAIPVGTLTSLPWTSPAEPLLSGFSSVSPLGG